VAANSSIGVPVPELFGLRTFSHGGQFVLTVISPMGAGAIIDCLQCYSGLSPVFEAGQPPRFLERREGGIDALIDRYDIEQVAHPRWQRLRQEFGDRTLCSD